MKTPRNVRGLSGWIVIIVSILINEQSLALILPPLDGTIRSEARIVIGIFNVLGCLLGVAIIISQKVWLGVTDTWSWTLGNGLFFLRGLFGALIIVLLVTQFTNMTSHIRVVSGNWGVVVATDSDAGLAISEAKKTTLFRGGSNFHGVLYQRFAHYLGYLSPVAFQDQDSEDESRELSIHYALQWISLVSLFSLSGLLSIILVKGIIVRLFSTLLISSSLMTSPQWIDLVFEAHPDLLLVFLFGLLVYFLHKWRCNRSVQYLVLAGVITGAALSTKLIFFIFLPGLIVIFFPPFRKNNIEWFLLFSTVTMLSALVLAYPRSTYFQETYAMINYQSNFSHPPTLNSIYLWFSRLYSQIWLPAITILGLWLLYGEANPHKNVSPLASWRLACVVLAPLGFFLTRNILSPSDHYTLPIVGGLTVLLCIVLSSSHTRWHYWLKTSRQKKTIDIVVGFIILGLLINGGGLVPDRAERKVETLMGQRSIATETYRKTSELALKDVTIFADGYVPYNRSQSNFIQGGQLSTTLEDFSKYDADYVLVNSREVARLMEAQDPQLYWGFEDGDSYEALVGFYSLFYNRSVFEFKPDEIWRKIFEDDNGAQIWERRNE